MSATVPAPRIDAPPDPTAWKIRAAMRGPADLEKPPPKEARQKMVVKIRYRTRRNLKWSDKVDVNRGEMPMNRIKSETDELMVVVEALRSLVIWTREGNWKERTIVEDGLESTLQNMIYELCIFFSSISLELT